MLVDVVVVVVDDIGAVAEAFTAAFDGPMAVLDDIAAFDIMLLSGVMTVLVSVLLVVVTLQAATETEATAAPTIRMVRSVPEVMSLVPFCG